MTISERKTMAEYTYKDVIIDPEDPRVEIGKEYYFGDSPKEALEYANKNGRGALLEDIDLVSNFPFLMENFDESAPCLIRKKEPEKKYVPFDLSDTEVRKSLRERWIESTRGEYQISGFHSFDGEDGEEWMVSITTGYVTPENLCALWKFDDGTPCGRLVEEE